MIKQPTIDYKITHWSFCFYLVGMESVPTAQRLRTLANDIALGKQASSDKYYNGLREALQTAFLKYMEERAKRGVLSIECSANHLIEIFLPNEKLVDVILNGRLRADLKIFAESPDHGFHWEERKAHCFQCDCEREEPCTLFVTIS